jgi:hypothetical protein
MDNALKSTHALMFNVFKDTLAKMDIVFQLTHAQTWTAIGASGVNSANVLPSHNANVIPTVLEVKFVNSEDVSINVP